MSALDQTVGISGSPAAVVQRILAEWREAERQLALVPPESDEFGRIHREAERLRTAYREVLDRVQASVTMSVRSSRRQEW